VHSLRVHSDNQVMGALQEVLKSKSLTKRVRTKKINHEEFKVSSKRTNTDENILTKAQRLAAKRNL
jgi:hypothetical protein